MTCRPNHVSRYHRSTQRVFLSILLAAMATCSSTTSAQLVSPIVAVRGVTPAGWSLANLSVGAAWSDPVDPSLPTYVITHGYNPAPELVRLSNPQAYALKIRARLSGRVNVMAYHWDSRG